MLNNRLWSERRSYVPKASWMIQWPLNHMVLKVLVHLANKAPAGNKMRNPTIHKTACATIFFSKGRRGKWNDPPDDG